jgi:hypothetical protein
MSERRHASDCRCYLCQFTNLQSKCFNLNKQNAELKAEVARLRELLTEAKSFCDQRFGNSLFYRIEEALAAVREKTECKCGLRERLVGDGCDVCNPKLAEELRGEKEEAR